jgi:hypothetical protein
MIQVHGRWIQTYTGKIIYLDNPKVSDINILDISHTLAYICRFNGCTTAFYSVAQHSVLTSTNVPHEHALWGLLHDASEAYLGDLTSPVKKAVGAPYLDFEEKFMNVICDFFGLDHHMPSVVRMVDEKLLLTERKCFILHQIPDWGYDAKPYRGRIIPWSPAMAERYFMERLHELYQPKGENYEQWTN